MLETYNIQESESVYNYFLSSNFYDKVAKKFGGYAYATNKLEYFSKYENQDPEKVFKDQPLALGDKEKVVLDIGCGDGKFAFETTNSFKKITGIDTSVKLLAIANKKQKEQNVTNTEFLLQSAEKTTFEAETFDILYNRRGPIFYNEYYRILKNGGFYLEIGIGQKDTLELKSIFGSGQGFGKWNLSRSLKDQAEFNKLGFNIKMAQDFYYSEYYVTREDFDRFLQGVPIFEDYDTEKDKNYFEEYVKKFSTEKGILLERHRVVYELVK